MAASSFVMWNGGKHEAPAKTLLSRAMNQAIKLTTAQRVKSPQWGRCENRSKVSFLHRFQRSKVTCTTRTQQLPVAYESVHFVLEFWPSHDPDLCLQMISDRLFVGWANICRRVRTHTHTHTSPCMICTRKLRKTLTNIISSRCGSIFLAKVYDCVVN